MFEQFFTQQWYIWVMAVLVLYVLYSSRARKRQMSKLTALQPAQPVRQPMADSRVQNGRAGQHTYRTDALTDVLDMVDGAVDRDRPGRRRSDDSGGDAPVVTPITYAAGRQHRDDDGTPAGRDSGRDDDGDTGGDGGGGDGGGD